jgi:hypothetical protein
MLLQATPRDSIGVLRMSVDWIHQQILMTEYPPLSLAYLSAL